MSKLYIKKGDTVYVNTGEDKGKMGRILKVLSEKYVLLEGVNIISKSVKPSAKHPHGGFEKKEAAIHISNLNLLDPISGKPTRIKRQLNKKEKMARFSKKSGEEIK